MHPFAFLQRVPKPGGLGTFLLIMQARTNENENASKHKTQNKTKLQPHESNPRKFPPTEKSLCRNACCCHLSSSLIGSYMAPHRRLQGLAFSWRPTPPSAQATTGPNWEATVSQTEREVQHQRRTINCAGTAAQNPTHRSLLRRLP